MPTPRNDLLRALGQALAPIRDFSSTLPDDDAAARFFLRAIHRDRCPACHATGVHLASARELHCQACGHRSLTSSTALRGTRLPLRIWLAAAWHIFVDTETLSARAFGRRYQLRAQTAWRLLHEVRGAIPYLRPRDAGTTVQLLGRQSPTNTAFVTLTHDDDLGLCAVVAEESTPSQSASPPVLALWLGRLRAWICDVFRGVSRRYLPRYLAELVARFRRVARGSGPQPSGFQDAFEPRGFGTR